MEIALGPGPWGCPYWTLASHCPQLQHCWPIHISLYTLCPLVPCCKHYSSSKLALMRPCPQAECPSFCIQGTAHTASFTTYPFVQKSSVCVSASCTKLEATLEEALGSVLSTDVVGEVRVVSMLPRHTESGGFPHSPVGCLQFPQHSLVAASGSQIGSLPLGRITPTEG